MFSCSQADTKMALHPYENKLGIKPANIAQIDTVHFTKIKWFGPSKNIGTVNEGDSILIKFKFENTGVHPLFISAVNTSCGCTNAQYSHEAVMPGMEDELSVIFNTIGQAVTFHKTITVTSNTSNGVKHLLSFEGKIDTLNRSLYRK